LTGTWLGIDTTSTLGGVALVKDGELLIESILPVKAFHSEKLLPAVSELMDSSGMRGGDLTGIGVSRGPGSYTGLRIGTATALGLSAGWGVPVKGVSTLRVISSLLPSGAVLCCIRARANELFAGAFSSPDPLSSEIITQGLYSSEDLLRLLAGKEYTAAGSGRTELHSAANIRWASPLLDNPRPSSAALCAAALAEEEGFDGNLEPLYLRGFNEKI